MLFLLFLFIILFIIAAFFLAGVQVILAERGIDAKKAFISIIKIYGVSVLLMILCAGIYSLFPHTTSQEQNVVDVPVPLTASEVLAQSNEWARIDDDTNPNPPRMATNDIRHLTLSVSNSVVTFYIDGEFYRSASITDSFAQSPVAYYGLETNLSPSRAENTNWQLQIDDQPDNGWRNYSPVFANSTEVKIVGWTQNYRLRQR